MINRLDDNISFFNDPHLKRRTDDISFIFVQDSVARNGRKEKERSNRGKNLGGNIYLHKPSGIISKRLLAAENTCNEDNLPIPDGMPSKSNKLSFRYNLLRVTILHREAGIVVNLLRHTFKVSNLVQSSETRTSFERFASEEKRNEEATKETSTHRSQWKVRLFDCCLYLNDVSSVKNRGHQVLEANHFETNRALVGSSKSPNSMGCYSTFVACHASAESLNSSTTVAAYNVKEKHETFSIEKSTTKTRRARA